MSPFHDTKKTPCKLIYVLVKLINLHLAYFNKCVHITSFDRLSGAYLVMFNNNFKMVFIVPRKLYLGIEENKHLDCKHR